MAAEIHPTAVVHPGTVLGDGVKVLEHAVVGKQPTLSPRSTAKREPLPPTVVGEGSVVSTGAILFAAERATQVALDAIQLLGGSGYVNESPAGRLLRDAKLYEIGAGTSEIRRMLIGRELVKGNG